MKILLIFSCLLLSTYTSFSQLNQIEYHTINFNQQPHPQIHVTMYYGKKAGGIGQSYWITIQNLTPKKISVKGKYFAILKCGNQSISTIDIVIEPHGKAVPRSGYLVDETGLFGKAQRELCDIKPTYENGKKIWHSIIDHVNYEITSIKEINISRQNQRHVKTPGTSKANIRKFSGPHLKWSVTKKLNPRYCDVFALIKTSDNKPSTI